ncbi:ARM repeat superfamily protein, putative isoform 2 [Hibiscus syriacus]|uniref:ARM repeat superfamily protein, putative isoform 2 n=1 Tax=Hibiscus syriacus TaxID=106335 RepID=A0A6A2XGL9_HIBSY|nr:ataxin-10-like [Hibiscus syriacus]KAE8661256.1 ARM repeat superfamily protein, putative isoform 2 [Hibiscus syriacus]
MVGESLPEFNDREDVLQPLLSASNSSSLHEALEVLIQASRDTVGRAELALRNILPTVLKLVESLHRTSNREYLMQSLKLLRNLCAGEVANQNSFLEQNGIEIVATVLRSAAFASDPDFGITRFSLQGLVNVSLAGAEHQQAIWLKLFPNEFFMLASIRSLETSDPLCMILYTCCDGRPGLATEHCRDSGLPILVGLIRTVVSVGYREDWFKLLLSRLCLEDIHFPALFSKLCEGNASENRGNTTLGDNCFSSEQAFLLRIISDILNERIDEVRFPDDSALCVLEIFKRSITIVDFATRGKSGLPTGSTSVDVMGYSLIILRDICAGDDVGDFKKDSVDIGMLLSNELLDILLSLLRDLELPSTIRKTLKDSENQELILHSSKLCPYKGFRRDLVAVIGNCAYRRKHVQAEIRQKNGIPLLLQQCVTDDDNPYLREWGIWSVRNLLEGNAENQQTVADLQLQGTIDTPELTRLGLRVEVDQNTRRAKLVNIPGSCQKPVE